MFYQIDDKFYVKMSNYYQELEVIKNLIVPKKGEKSRIYNPSSEPKAVSSEQVLISASKKNNKKEDLGIL